MLISTPDATAGLALARLPTDDGMADRNSSFTPALPKSWRSIARNHSRRREAEGTRRRPRRCRIVKPGSIFAVSTQAQPHSWRGGLDDDGASSSTVRAAPPHKRSAELESLTIRPGPATAASDHDVISVSRSRWRCTPWTHAAARGVELRFFGGLENEEIAEVLGIAHRLRATGCWRVPGCTANCFGTDAVDAQKSRLQPVGHGRGPPESRHAQDPGFVDDSEDIRELPPDDGAGQRFEARWRWTASRRCYAAGALKPDLVLSTS